MAKYAFKKGWDQLPNAKLGEARRKLMTALNLKGDSNFYRRLRGIPEPTISEGEAIVAIFEEYGITEVWGE